MADANAAYFFCDQPLTGNHVHIQQQPTDKEISICEMAVFQETKRKRTLSFLIIPCQDTLNMPRVRMFKITKQRNNVLIA